MLTPAERIRRFKEVNEAKRWQGNSCALDHLIDDMVRDENIERQRWKEAAENGVFRNPTAT